MLATFAMSVCLVVCAAEDIAPPNRAAYEVLKAKSGRSAESHVRLALWCESRGMISERLKHLAIAVLNDPRNAKARGLLGLVEYGGKWKRPEAVSDAVKSDDKLNAALAEYNGRRERAPLTVDAQWKLGVWCEQNGLAPEAMAHFTAVNRMQPKHEGALKQLGFRNVGGRWVKEGQIAAEKAEQEAQKKADKFWSKQLLKWREGLADSKKHDASEKSLETVDDPRAIPAIVAVFGVGTEREQIRAAAMLNRIVTEGSSQGLAMLAVFSPSAQVRQRAAESLRSRDIRDYIGWMISLLRNELKYEVKYNDGIGSEGVLIVEGEKYKVRRRYTSPSLPIFTLFPGEPISYDSEGLPVVGRVTGGRRIYQPAEGMELDIHPMSRFDMSSALSGGGSNGSQLPGGLRLDGDEIIANASSSFGLEVSGILYTENPQTHVTQIPIGQIVREYQKKVKSSADDLAADVAAVERENVGIREQNQRVAQILGNVTGHDGGTDREDWKTWAIDRQGFAYKSAAEPEKPILEEVVEASYESPLIQARLGIVSCFKAGTMVKILQGEQSIETIHPGDVVLSQDTATGALEYQPVLAIFHNPPALTLKVSLGAESISATGFHKFWKPGHGWVMARDLKPGDKVRTLNGTTEVASVEPETMVPVFNLEIAGGQTFFVGNSGALVHDNTRTQSFYQKFDDEPAGASVADGR